MPLLKKYLVIDNKWLKEEDLIDYLALSQCLPGLIALNITIFSGYALRKILGSIVAVFALTLSPFLIILFIAGFIYNFAKYPIVQNAFFGIRLSIIVLIFYMIKDIFTKSVNSKFTVFLFLLILLSNIFLPLGPSSLVVLAILISILFGLIQDKKERAKLKWLKLCFYFLLNILKREFFLLAAGTLLCHFYIIWHKTMIGLQQKNL